MGNAIYNISIRSGRRSFQVHPIRRSIVALVHNKFVALFDILHRSLTSFAGPHPNRPCLTVRP